jgi:hypothetical protein
MPSGIPQVAEDGSGFSRCWLLRNVDSRRFWEGHDFNRAANDRQKCGL